MSKQWVPAWERAYSPSLHDPPRVEPTQRDYAPVPTSAVLRSYDLTESEWRELYDLQGGKCAICETIPLKGLVVDHDHATGAVRGLLCTGCNLGLGVVERPGFVEAARQYAQFHPRRVLGY